MEIYIDISDQIASSTTGIYEKSWIYASLGVTLSCYKNFALFSLWLSVKNVCHKSVENPSKSHFCIFFYSSTSSFYSCSFLRTSFSFVMCHLPFVNSFQVPPATPKKPRKAAFLKAVSERKTRTNHVSKKVSNINFPCSFFHLNLNSLSNIIFTKKLRKGTFIFWAFLAWEIVNLWPIFHGRLHSPIL